MTNLQTGADFIHHRPVVGAHTACMYESGSITTSTSWAMVTCPACIQVHETPPFEDPMYRGLPSGARAAGYDYAQDRHEEMVERMRVPHPAEY